MCQQIAEKTVECPELREARRQIDDLQAALDVRQEIGMAMGIVMARQYVAAGQAFALLRDASRAQHRPLRDVAADVVARGRLDP
ncbi:MAG TPA: ANTAR domain-containing protein [Jatrophihabitans sp.]|nr:ANTAR domain-containing protein [Jatrophihabitans sp.]